MALLAWANVSDATIGEPEDLSGGTGPTLPPGFTVKTNEAVASLVITRITQ